MGLPDISERPTHRLRPFRTSGPAGDLPAPHDGERCGELVYHGRRAIWLYPASYDDSAVCIRNRVTGLTHSWGVTFYCGWFGARSALPSDLGWAIPGYYAYTTGDPRPALRPYTPPAHVDTGELGDLHRLHGLHSQKEARRG